MTNTSSDRRRAILKAAARLFEHYGHAKTTIADVAREAQVGVGTVYLEFESKEAIVQELSLATHVGVLDAMRAAIKPEDDHATQLTAVLLARTRCFVELRRKGEHACELVHCKAEGVRAAHQRFKEQEQVLLQLIIEQGQSAGTFSACESRAMVRLVQRAFASLSPPWIFGSDEDALRASSDLCKLLLHGLLAEKDPSAFTPASTAGPQESKQSKRAIAGRTPTRKR
ncbi:MAG TPA: TetR/AcrR family transcriptional regulator [Labilithrix sp.]|nr:TetR/AcrR family transcriptional regulator [Labilithrix sp.]